MDKYEQLKTIIKNSNSIVVFSGAGISTASGIPDFRSEDGLFNQKEKYPPEEIVSHHFFYQNTDLFYDFYKNKMMYLNAKPNKAHEYFASLQGKRQVVIVTQNIDGLHQLAGSKYVYELHGSIHRNYCEDCHSFYDASYVKKYNGIPRCKKCGGLIKPDVVLYEEGLNEDIIMRSINAISTCDTLIIVGTSLLVYPAANFINYFKGKNLILINKSKTNYDHICDLVFYEDIVSVIEKIK